ncbi:hypothetical protein [Maribacter aestuarii]|uniref:hypothetical protein n=1 Tax=Maribacter aestuarii TaxID=1130723 RepID=UPI0025A5681F|nr:hypothetical protein [Maribacter aestuarii]
MIFSCSSEEQQVQKDIQKLLDQCVLAVTTKDIDLYMQGIPDDFVIKDENGNYITKKMQREYALRDWAIIDTTLSNNYVVDSLRVYGDSAMVFTSQKWKRIMFQKDGVTTDTVLTAQTHREVWKKRKSVWINYKIDELGGDIFVNGQKYNP